MPLNLLSVDILDPEFGPQSDRNEYTRIAAANAIRMKTLITHLQYAADAEDALDEFYIRMPVEMPSYAENVYDDNIPHGQRRLSLRIKKIFRWSTRIVGWMKKHRNTFQTFVTATTEQFSQMSTVIHKQSGVMTQFMRTSNAQYTKLVGKVEGAILICEDRDKFLVEELENAQVRYDKTMDQINTAFKKTQAERALILNAHSASVLSLSARLERVEALYAAQAKQLFFVGSP